jgi:rod shape-determining protein MreD
MSRGGGFSGQLGGGFGGNLGSGLGGGSRAARPLNPLTWLILPALVVVLLTFLLGTPMEAFGLRLPEPVWAVGLAFAWASLRPSLAAPILLLIVGLFLDLFWGAPMGLWALSLLLAYTAVWLGRPFISGQGYAASWAWYAATTAVAIGAAYLFTTLDAQVRPHIWAVLSQALVTALLYPLVARTLEQFEDVDPRFR